MCFGRFQPFPAFSLSAYDFNIFLYIINLTIRQCVKLKGKLDLRKKLKIVPLSQKPSWLPFFLKKAFLLQEKIYFWNTTHFLTSF